MALKAKRDLPVLFTSRSCDPKLAFVGKTPGRERERYHPMRPYISATYLPISQTCGDGCPFKGSPLEPGGCYALAGRSKFTVARLQAAAAGMTTDEIIELEARMIERRARHRRVPRDGYLGRGRDLRLHVSGDVCSTAQAKRLAIAAEKYRAATHAAVFSFTHSWRKVPRSPWGPISTLASVENPRDIVLAKKAGYVPAITVSELPNGPKPFRIAGVKGQLQPCVQQTVGVPCVRCRLCLDDASLRSRNVTIAFAVHGERAEAAREALPLVTVIGSDGPRSK